MPASDRSVVLADALFGDRRAAAWAHAGLPRAAPRFLRFVLCDHVAVAPAGACSAGKAELMPTVPETVCLLVAG